MPTLARLLLVSLLLLAGACQVRQPAKPADPDPPTEGEIQGLPRSGQGALDTGGERDIIRGIRQHTFSEIGADVDPDLSPDGKRLFFASTHQSKRFDIFYKDKGSSTIVQKTFNPWDDRSPKISPDGRWMAFVSNRRGNWDLYLVLAGNSNKETRLTDDESDEINPAWSPDGRMIAYSSRNRRSGKWEIKILDLHTKTTMMIEGVEGLFPEWSPNGKKIVFQRSRSRKPQWYAIWMINVDGSELTELVSSPDWAAINPNWTGDGKHIVFSTVAKSPEVGNDPMTADDIWIIQTDGTNLTRLTAGLEAEWDPTIGPDGRVYFCSTRAGHKNIWSAELNLLDITHMQPSQGKVLPTVRIGTASWRANMKETKPDIDTDHMVDDFDMLDELDGLSRKDRKE